MLQFDKIEISSNHPVKLHSRYVSDIADIIFQCNGYIAGGYVDYFLRYAMSYTDCESTVNAVKYMITSRWNRGDYKNAISDRNLSIYRGAITSDIDFYFRNDKDCAKANQLINVYKAEHPDAFGSDRRTIANFGRDLTLKHDHKKYINVQLIDGFFGEPDEVVSSFDFANCALFMDKDFIYVNHLWDNLYRQRKIHVMSVQNFFPNRYNKYCSKYYSGGISDETKHVITQWLRDVYEKVQSLAIANDNNGAKLLVMKMQRVINSTFDSVDDELLLITSMLEKCYLGVTDSDYMSVFNQLMSKRAPKLNTRLRRY